MYVVVGRSAENKGGRAANENAAAETISMT